MRKVKYLCGFMYFGILIIYVIRLFIYLIIFWRGYFVLDIDNIVLIRKDKIFIFRELSFGERR